MINVAPVILFGVEFDKLAMPGSDRDWGRGSFHEITYLKDPGWSCLACKAGFSASNLEPCFQRTVQADCRGESTVLFLVSDRQRPAGLGRREHVENILGSLLPDETCPKCGEVLPGNYKFCPYDGTRLESVPVPASSPGS